MKLNANSQAAAYALHQESNHALQRIQTSLRHSSDKSQALARTCIIIDSEVDASAALASCLGAQGFKVWAAVSGEEGLSIIRQVHPALVLVDLKPKGIGGPALLASIRRLSPHSRIVVLTGWTFDYLEAVVREFHVDVCCLKPVSVAGVLRIIGQILLIG